ncbi:hypothetical protein FH972_025113 [Carpinus fangiana]|uniref:Uncharacterized protein n=1 Tax=Carpinus fangiana TaxID=176857 RepID=A0A5N6L031_9ROSI|nr:hypothetical protein FH972_025113 [Carpinus fangiana]
MVRRDSNSSFSSAPGGGGGGGSQRQPFSSGLQRRGSSSSMTDRSFRSPSPGRGLSIPPVPEIPTEIIPPIPARSTRRTSGSQDMPSPKLDTSGQPGQTAVNTGKQRQPRPANVAANIAAQPAQSSPISPRSINFSRPMSPPVPGSSAARPASTLGFHREKEEYHEYGSDARTKALQAARTTTSPRGTAPYHTGGQVTAGGAVAAANIARSNTTSSRPANPRQNSTDPTPDQIRAYQSRAASLLARPRSEAYVPPPPAPSSKVNRTSSLLTPAGSSPAQQKKSQGPQTPTSASGHVRSGSQPIAQLSSDNASLTRSVSVSPARSARFSDTPVIEGIKHQPPTRAISPYKSALKSTSRPQSPAFRAPSEAGSDTASLLSESGTLKKKKSVRVSFDERPLTVGDAASPQSPGNTILSPQNQRFNDEEFSGMGGAPVLPSFGSVRKARSEESPSGRPTAAAAFAQEESDEEGLVAAAGAPVIAVQPATPLLDEDARKQLESPRSSDEVAPGRHSLEDMMSAEDSPNVVNSRPHEFTENESPSIPSAVGSAQPSNEEPRISSEYDTDEDGDQEYSDAAEDPSELDARGFASLDAILESPTAEKDELPASAAKTTFTEPAAFEPPAAPTEAPPIGVAIGSADDDMETPEDEDEDWDKVRAYWSGLSEQSKQQIEAAATPLPAKGEEGAATKKKSKAGAKDPKTGVPLPPWPDKEYQQQAIQPKSARQAGGHERTTSSPQQKARSPMRTSLRGNDKATARLSQPVAATPRQAAPPPRPLSTVTPSASTAQAIARAKAARTAKPAALTRSDSAGSESSFKKARRAKNDDSKYSMRQSMRSQAPARKEKAASKESARPMSPDSNPRISMRQSMRRNSVSSMDSRMSKESTTSKFSLFGRSSSKTRGAQPKAAKVTKKSGGSSFTSRFEDSDDSDDGGRPAFRSRFADSDDSDDGRPMPVTKLTPVRGIPRKNGQVSGESTDLDDSDVEIPSHVAAAAAVTTPTPAPATEPEKVVTNGATEGAVLQSGTLRGAKPAEKKKSKGLWGFGRKKKEVAGSEAGSVPNSPVAVTAFPASPTSPVVNGRPSTPPNATPLANGDVASPGSVQTPASPTAALSQNASPAIPSTLRKETPPNRKRSSSRASSIFKRWSMSAPTSPAQTPEHGNSFPFQPAPPIPAIPDEYKLSPAPAGNGGVRPITSDGITLSSSQRPALGGKRDSHMTAPESGTVVEGGQPHEVIYSMRTGKKKKFQGLRRKLGIHD